MKDVLQVRDLTVQIERKNIKNLYIRIKRDGRVVVTCPNPTTDREVRYVVDERMHWIVTHRQQVLVRQAAQSPRDGSAPLWGQRLPLVAVGDSWAKPHVTRGQEVLLVHGPSQDEQGQAAVLESFYRTELLSAIPAAMIRAEAATGLHAQQWRIRKMHTRWGSCNIPSRRIWLSLNLAKYPQECLYMVIIHELTHLLEPKHNAHFYHLMDRFYPAWRDADRVLKESPL